MGAGSQGGTRYGTSVPMRHFLYLDTTALDGYLSALEGGLRTEIERESEASRGGSLEGNLKIAKGTADRSKSEIDRTRELDTAEARFSRLLLLAQKEPENLDWIDVVDPDTDLETVGFGAMVAGEADFYVPGIIRTLSNRGDMNAALDMIDQLEPLAEFLDLDTEGLPDRNLRNAMRGIVGAINADLVAVGEFDGSDWKIAAQLTGAYRRAELEGPARFVGKVSKRWPAGEGRPLMALPGTTLMPRKERRDLERKRPDDPSDESFLAGPAMMLDLLAAWR
jgi:hypothetical protein